MDSQKILLDTSILIDFFRKKNKSKLILYQLIPEYEFCLSIITSFGIRIGIKTDRQKRDYEILIEYFDILPIDEACIDVAVDIYTFLKKRNAMIELADLFIGATAVSNSLRLATLNRKHFNNIPDLMLLPLPG